MRVELLGRTGRPPSLLPSAVAPQSSLVHYNGGARDTQTRDHAPRGCHLREAETLAEAIGDQRRLGWVCAYRSSYYSASTHDLDHAAEAGQRALAMATVCRDFDLQIAAHFFLSQAYFRLGDCRRAIDFAKQNTAVLTDDWLWGRSDLPAPPSVLSRAHLLRSLAWLGECAEATTHGEEMVRIAEAIDHPCSLVFAYAAVADLHLLKGDLQKAMQSFARSLELCRVWNIRQLSTATCEPGEKFCGGCGTPLVLKGLDKPLAVYRVCQNAV